MSEHDSLQQALGQLLDGGLPAQATRHINDALLLANRIEAKGFGFRLSDARPKDPVSSLWKAAFSKDGRVFQQEDPDAALAVCRAALAALQG